MDGFKYDTLGPFIEKDPQSLLDYHLDWSKPSNSWLGSDIIQSVVWTVQSGITQANTSFTNTKATIWLSGGTDQQTYSIACKITTLGGRVDERTFRVKVKER